MSWDWFLGSSFNIASYAILAKLLEAITGHKAKGILATGLNVHLYENQIEPSKELIKRDANENQKCELAFSDRLIKMCKEYNGDVDTIFQNMEISDFSLKNYTHSGKLGVKMIAPIKI